MEEKMRRAEVLLRLSSLLLAALAACLVGLDTQTKHIFFSIEKKVTKKDLQALSVMVTVEAVAAGYQFLQLCKSFKINPSAHNKALAWLNFILDQMTAYATFGALAAATQASSLAVSGAEYFQWSKWCSTYTRFCEQIGGGLLCGFAATLFMAAVASISAFHVYRAFCSSKQKQPSPAAVNRGPL